MNPRRSESGTTTLQKGVDFLEWFSDPPSTFTALQEHRVPTEALTAVITGGTSGIGRAAAKKRAQAGIHGLLVGPQSETGRERGRTAI